MSDKVLVIGGDVAIAEAVVSALAERGVAGRLTADGDPFDAALELGATGVLLVEAREPDQALFDAALGAAKAPGVSFFACVTPRAADDAALVRLRRDGVPYGILLTPAIFDVKLEPRARRVLVRRELAEALAAERPVSPARLAAEIARFVAEERVREGATDTVRGDERPLEARLAELGAEPLVLPGWRVALNGFFGMPVVERAGGSVLVAGRRAEQCTA